MSVSLIISLMSVQLNPRHIIQSILNQTRPITEVLLYHSEEIHIPTDLPEHWKIQKVPATYTQAEVWNLGAEASSQKYICFTRADQIYHARHFEIASKTLEASSKDGVYSDCQFIGDDLYSLPAGGRQTPRPEQWITAIIAQDIKLPLGAFLLTKSSLPKVVFDIDYDFYNAESFLLYWLLNHSLEFVPLATVSTLLNKTTDILPEMQKAEIETLLETYLDSLPQEKVFHYETKETQKRSILQALYQRELTDLSQQYLDKNKETLTHPNKKTVLWLSYEFQNLDQLHKSFWKNDFLQKHYNMVILNLSSLQDPTRKPYMEEYSYRHGIYWVNIINIPPQAIDSSKYNYIPEIINLTQKVIKRYSPEFVHITSLKGFSLDLPPMLEDQNIPCIYSYTDNSLLQYRKELLMRPNQKKSAANLITNQKSFHFINHQVSHLITSTPKQYKELKTYKTEGISLIDAQNIESVYSNIKFKTAQQHQIPEFFQSLANHIKTPLKVKYENYLDVFHKAQFTIDYEPHGEQLIELLKTVKIPAIGIKKSNGVAKPKENNIIHTGGSKTLSKYLGTFDVFHTAYTLEELSPKELVPFLTQVQQSLKKYGKAVFRLLNINNQTIKETGFWLNENNIRPYPLSLLQHILEFCGFQIESQVTESLEGEDNYLISSLQFDNYPPANHPISTPGFKEFWESQMPMLTLPESGNLLIIGPQIAKLWKIYRVQMDGSMGITLDLNEMDSIGKSTPQHTFRFTQDLMHTLKHVSRRFDAVLLQGLLETLSPKEVSELIQWCKEHMTDKAPLYIQTLMPTPSGDIPDVFWESLLNIRPYPEINKLLASQNFEVTHEDGQLCKLYQAEFNPEINIVTEKELWPEQVEALFEGSNFKNITCLRTPNSPVTKNYILDHVLEDCHPHTLTQDLNAFYQGLPIYAEVIVRAMVNKEQVLATNTAYRHFNASSISHILNKTGFQTIQHWTDKDNIIWHLRKLSSAQDETGFESSDLLLSGEFSTESLLSGVNYSLLDCLQTTEPVKRIELHPKSPQKKNNLGKYISLAYKGYASTEVEISHQSMPNIDKPTHTGYFIHYQNWNYGSLPEDWIQHFNSLTDQIWVPSKYLKNIFMDSGLIGDKIKVLPYPINFDQFSPTAPELKLDTAKKYKFLYLGANSKLHGLDLLLNAYSQSFSNEEDVSLVVYLTKEELSKEELFDYKEWLEQQEKTDLPEIIFLDNPLSNGERAALYSSCDCVVSAHRGIGISQVTAEAMASQKVIIATEGGANTDFCSDENTYLIPAEKQFKDKQIVHNNLVTVKLPYLYEPDFDLLKIFMRQVYDSPQEANLKAKAGGKSIQNYCSLEQTSSLLAKYLEELQSQPVFRLNKDHLLSVKLNEAFKYFNEEEYTKAIELFEYALSIERFQPNIAYNLGISYLITQQHEKALDNFTLSLRDGECTADLCMAMGNTLKKLGDLETAEEFMEKAKELDPSLFTQV